MWVSTGWYVYNADIKQNRTVSILSKKEENCKLSTTKSCANQALKVKLHRLRGKSAIEKNI